MTDIARLRVSDTDRNGVVARLQDATAEGRLSLDELEERITDALAAKTWADLDVLVDDLPVVAEAEPVADEPGEDEPGWLPPIVVQAAAVATLGIGAASIPVAFMSGAGVAVGFFAALLGVLVVAAPGYLSRLYRLAAVGGIALGLLPVVFYVFLFLNFTL